MTKEDTIISQVEFVKPGAPSRYILVLQIFVLGGIERKWKMCCRDKKQQDEWYASLNKFNGPPAINLGHDIISFLSMAPPTPVHSGTEKAGVRRRMSERITSSLAKSFNLNPNKDATDAKDKCPPSTCLFLFAGLNALLLAARTADNQTFWLCVVLGNALLYKALFTPPPQGEKLHLGSAAGDAAAARNSSRPPAAATRQKSVAHVEAGSTFDRCPPTPESKSAALLKKNGTLKNLEGVRMCGGVGLDDFTRCPHTYWSGDSSKFHVRMGPNYKKTGKKEPSKQGLFDLCSVDLLRTDVRVKESGDIFNRPEIPGVTDRDTGHAYIPSLFIVNCSVPC